LTHLLKMPRTGIAVGNVSSDFFGAKTVLTPAPLAHEQADVPLNIGAGYFLHSP
jgi:hypothetical protein